MASFSVIWRNAYTGRVVKEHVDVRAASPQRAMDISRQKCYAEGMQPNYLTPEVKTGEKIVALESSEVQQKKMDAAKQHYWWEDL